MYWISKRGEDGWDTFVWSSISSKSSMDEVLGVFFLPIRAAESLAWVKVLAFQQ